MHYALMQLWCTQNLVCVKRSFGLQWHGLYLMREPTVEDAVACNLTQVGGTQLPHLHHSVALTLGWTTSGHVAMLNRMWVARVSRLAHHGSCCQC